MLAGTCASLTVKENIVNKLLNLNAAVLQILKPLYSCGFTAGMLDMFSGREQTFAFF